MRTSIFTARRSAECLNSARAGSAALGLVDRQLGEALGQEFVSRAFSPEMKQKTLTMTTQIEQAMADRYPATFLDGSRDQAERAGQAAHDREQDRLSR